MYRKSFFSLKAILCIILAIAVLWVSPEHLYSQTAPGSRSTTTAPVTTPTTTPTTSPTTTTPATIPVRKPADTSDQAKSVVPPVQPSQENVFQRPSIATQAALLALLSVLPFIVMILTSFLKIVIVLSLLRNALGVQQAPPNQIINGVALMLSVYVMYPTGLKMYDAAQGVIDQKNVPEELLSKDSASYFMDIAAAAREPLQDFLKRNSSVKHQALFYKMAYRIIPEEYRSDLKNDDFIIIVPGYITSQLKDAFEIGVLIYIPFFVIDLVTSNILLAMGMMMLSPVTISMPLKLFLLVMLDGWTLLIEGLVSTFR